LKALEKDIYSHIEPPEENEEKESLYHLPDMNLLLWPELGFLNLYDMKYK
jgi:hypothetical protein